jgi:hypothetical protein
VLIKQPVLVNIRFDNTGKTRKRVTFTADVPSGLIRTFNVDRTGVSFTIDVKNAKNGSYPYEVSGGSSGQGGIEIDGAPPSAKAISK